MLSPRLVPFGACQYVEYDPATNTLANTANAVTCPSGSSFIGHLMILPTGQIMNTDFGNFIEVYTSDARRCSGRGPDYPGGLHALEGRLRQQRVVREAAQWLVGVYGYGDDYQGSTNYPLVRLTKTSNGNVYWALTHDESTHSITPGVIMYTKFDIPASVPNGTYRLNTVASGILSNSVVVSIP